MKRSVHTVGESFAYFAWHRLKFPHCPAFSPPRPWRIAAWSAGLRGKSEYLSNVGYLSDEQGTQP